MDETSNSHDKDESFREQAGRRTKKVKEYTKKVILKKRN
jgi:hypothetical protein